MLSLHASAFTPTAYGVEVTRSPGYPGFLFPSFSVEAAPLWPAVTLPTGAVLDSIDFYYYDGAVTDICARLWEYTGPTLGGNPPADEISGSVCSSGSGGYGYAIESLTGTIDNSVWFSNGAQYSVVIDSPSGPLGSPSGGRA